MRTSAYPAEAGWKDSDVSKKQAERIEKRGRANDLRSKVARLYEAGFTGTADEAASLLKENPLAIRPRCSELMTQRKLYRTNERRRSSGGGMAAVLRWVHL